MDDALIYDSVKLRINAFEKRHGGPEVAVRVSGWILYPNGAARETNPLGALLDPSTDKLERARNILFYHETRLRLATEAFTERKRFYAENARVALKERFAPVLPVAQDAAVKELNELLTRVRECQAAVDEARKAVVAAKPQHVAEAEAQSARNKDAAQSMLNALESFKI